MNATKPMKESDSLPINNQLPKLFRRIVASKSTLFRNSDGTVAIETNDADLRADVTNLQASIAAAVNPSIDHEQRNAARDLLHGFTVELIEDVATAERAVAELTRRAKLSGCLAFDTETAVRSEFLTPVPVVFTKAGSIAKRQPKTGVAGYALNPRKSRVRLIQAYAGGRQVALFDMSKLAPSVIAPLLQDVPALAAFNAVFDAKFLLSDGYAEPTPRIYDVMTAMRLINGSRDNMAKSAMTLLGIEVPKGLGASDWHRQNLNQDQLDYAAIDALITFWLWEKQRDLLDDVDEHAQSLSDDLIVPVARMELAGLPISRERHTSKVAHWQSSLADAQKDLASATKSQLRDIPTSRQVCAYLEGTLSADNLEAWPRTKKNEQLCTDQKALKNHGADIPGIPELLTVRAWAKALSTYGDNLAQHIDDDDRIRSSFLIAGARTGRFSSRNVNLQNQPKRGKLLAGFRDIFAAKPGHIIISADYSQIELRIAAELSGDTEMREAFRQRIDLHTRTASLLTTDEPTREDRTLAKAANFGLLYGSGVRGFRNFAKATYGLDLTHNDADELISDFFAAYPELHRWRFRQERETRRDGVVSTLGGRRWDFSWRSHTADDKGFDDLENWQINDWLDGYERNFALNHPIQGVAAEVIGVALCYVDKALRHLPARIVATVHDELVIECANNPDTVRAVRRNLNARMTRAWLEFFPDAPWRGVVDITQGPSWGEQEKT
ncbi:DNA polymerase [Ruegeria atlantica]|uniref:DNA polymerase I n=1 Tax=Ruegeria atlantica TaxID=81569 RepID=A0A0P1E1T5_9RHOB|nr:DNA polymerase [Ruegeria atlantica]CUH42058.1 DNA polymerase I, thermostable [Ruegeria atlantica]